MRRTAHGRGVGALGAEVVGHHKVLRKRGSMRNSYSGLDARFVVPYNEAMDTKRFATTVNDFAKAAPAASGNKVFIGEVAGPVCAELGLSRAQFNKRIVEANRDGELVLHRCDLPYIHERAMVALSTVAHPGGAEFHFVEPT